MKNPAGYAGMVRDWAHENPRAAAVIRSAMREQVVDTIQGMDGNSWRQFQQRFPEASSAMLQWASNNAEKADEIRGLVREIRDGSDGAVARVHAWAEANHAAAAVLRRVTRAKLIEAIQHLDSADVPPHFTNLIRQWASRNPRKAQRLVRVIAGIRDEASLFEVGDEPLVAVEGTELAVEGTELESTPFDFDAEAAEASAADEQVLETEEESESIEALPEHLVGYVTRVHTWVAENPAAAAVIRSAIREQVIDLIRMEGDTWVQLQRRYPVAASAMRQWAQNNPTKAGEVRELVSEVRNGADGALARLRAWAATNQAGAAVLRRVTRAKLVGAIQHLDSVASPRYTNLVRIWARRNPNKARRLVRVIFNSRDETSLLEIVDEPLEAEEDTELASTEFDFDAEAEEASAADEQAMEDEEETIEVPANLVGFVARVRDWADENPAVAAVIRSALREQIIETIQGMRRKSWRQFERRFPRVSSAMVAWARTHPAEADAILEIMRDASDDENGAVARMRAWAVANQAGAAVLRRVTRAKLIEVIQFALSGRDLPHYSNLVRQWARNNPAQARAVVLLIRGVHNDASLLGIGDEPWEAEEGTELDEESLEDEAEPVDPALKAQCLDHRETRGKCRVFGCHPWRGADCVSGRCICPEGTCSADLGNGRRERGVCVDANTWDLARNSVL